MLEQFLGGGILPILAVVGAVTLAILAAVMLARGAEAGVFPRSPNLA